MRGHWQIQYHSLAGQGHPRIPEEAAGKQTPQIGWPASSQGALGASCIKYPPITGCHHLLVTALAGPDPTPSFHPQHCRWIGVAGRAHIWRRLRADQNPFRRQCREREYEGAPGRTLHAPLYYLALAKDSRHTQYHVSAGCEGAEGSYNSFWS